MLNMKRRIRMTIFLWIMIAIMAGVALLSTTLNANAEPLKEKEVAVVILWYTATGEPQNIFIVDALHVGREDNTVIIDRTPGEEPHQPDQVLMGGMFDIQTFGYSQVFSFQGLGKWELKEHFNNFAIQFKNKANEHLALGKKGQKK